MEYKVKLPDNFDIDKIQSLDDISDSIVNQIFILRIEIIGVEGTSMRAYQNETLKQVDFILKELVNKKEIIFRLPNGVYSNIPKDKRNCFERKIVEYMLKLLKIS